MSVSADDVRHIAELAQLGLDEDRTERLRGELNGILAHMDVLRAVDTDRVVEGESATSALPLRVDAGPADSLLRPIESIAPLTREGFFVVPRLATHDDRAKEAARE